MLKLDTNLKRKFEEAANALCSRLEQKPPVDVLRNMILDKQIGSFHHCQKFLPKDLTQIVEKGGIAGVDGSTNSTGGPFPYMITLQQALAKACDCRNADVTLTDAFSPLTMDEPITEDEYRDYVKRNLATLEAEVALEALELLSPRVMLLDGSLVRFRIEATSTWEKLKNQAIAQNTLLVGVVEGISTGLISSCLKSWLQPVANPASDWEVLFGLLQVGELLEIAPGLFKEGFRTCFIRSARDPKPIGIDLPEEQQSHLKEVADLIYTLTPEDSRGVPLWLDIIDNNVRITDSMIEGLLNTYVGEDYVEFLRPKRKNRNI